MDKKEKTYTPEEVAAAILKRVKELANTSTLYKSANTSHEIEAGEEPNNDDAEAPEYLADADIEDDYKEDEKRKGKKSSSSSESSEAGADSSEPEHEQGMSEEENEEHDAAENEADEEDADKIEADEEDSSIQDEDDAEMQDTDDIIDDAADDSESKDKKKKKPFEKSEGKLKKFMARRSIKKGEMAKQPAKVAMPKPATNRPHPVSTDKKAKEKLAKNKAVEGMLGMNKKQGVPKGADPATHERCVKDVKAQGHDKTSAYKICNAAGAGKKGGSK